MMSTWTATDPLRHPWFASSSLKRKHSNSSEEEDAADVAREPDSDFDHDPASTVYPTPPPERLGIYDGYAHGERKRRRCDTIERRMARMYIEPEDVQAMSLAQAASLSTASDASYYTAGSTSPVPRSAMLDAYAVEEPTSPVFRENVILPPSLMRSEASQVSDVRMKGTEPVWYEREKDRIVITDLDAAAEEAENEYMSKAEPHPDAAGHADSNEDYSISAVLFDHIKRQANFPYVPRTKEKEPGALVLFKPPPLEFFAPLGTEPQTKQEEKEKNETRKVRVEEIDLDIANIQQPPGGYEVGTVSMEQEDEDLGELMEMDMDVEL